MKPTAALWRLVLSVVLAVVLMIAIANVIKNPVAVDSRTYTAEFTDASGLHADGDVRVRGVRVGKVESVDLVRRNKQNLAAVKFTLDKRYGVVDATKLAIKFQALTGVRYMDVTNPAEGYAQADLVTRVPIANTQPSFDVTALFNGLQPVLATLSPEELNTFASNVASFLSDSDGSGLGPLLASLRKLTQFVSNRQQVVATLVSNIAQLSDAIGGKGKEFIQIIDYVNKNTIDAAMKVADEFRKSQLYGPEFTDATIRLLHNAGIRPGINIDAALDRAFSNLDNFFDAFKLVPVFWENIPPPGQGVTAPDQDGAPPIGTPQPCTRGPAQLPETMDVLLNGRRVVLCNR